MENCFLKLENLFLSYEDVHVLKGVDLCVNEGEIICILGASGCGKTSLLRTVAGFEPPSRGTITLSDKTLFSSNQEVPAEKRRIGFVFQDLALFPHLSVFENIAFGLTGMSKQSVISRVEEMLQLIGLSELGARYPHELSGGQKQRVALARAIAPSPQMLLLDEPFSSLDEEMAEGMNRELRVLLKKLGITAIMVTHNQQEAYAIADRIAVMFDGKISQVSSAENLYNCPANYSVAQFIGDGFLLKGEVIQNKGIECALGLIGVDALAPANENSDLSVLDGETALFIRPEDLEVSEGDHSKGTKIKVESITYLGPYSMLVGKTAGGELIKYRLPSSMKPDLEEITLKLKDSARVVVYGEC